MYDADLPELRARIPYARWTGKGRRRRRLCGKTAAASAGALVVCTTTAAQQVIYSNDFESGAGAGWSQSTTSQSPGGSLPPTGFLGEFGPEAVTLDLGTRPAGLYQVAFDLLTIRSWDGNGPGSAPDGFSIERGASILFASTFANVAGTAQTFPSQLPPNGGGGSFAPGSGAAAVNAMGFEFEGTPMDALYSLGGQSAISFVHGGGPLAITFRSTQTEPMANESWGLDNVAVTALSTVVGLCDWTELDYAGNGSAGTWTPSGDCLTILQTINGEPTYWVSPFDLVDSDFNGFFEVKTNDDDDWIGFVFGFKGLTALPSYYILTWKKNAQGNGEQGLKVLRVNGVPNAIPGNWSELGDGENSAHIKVLGTKIGAGNGWKSFTKYSFQLKYQANGQMRIIVKEVGTGLLVWDTGNIVDPEPIGAGKVGFFNYSQAQVEYSGFLATPLLPPSAVPGGPYQLDASLAGVVADATASSDPDAVEEGLFNGIVAVQWDLGNDGLADDGLHMHPQQDFTTEELFGKGLALGVPVPLRLIVTDSDGLVGEAVTSIAFASTAPSALAGGPYGPVAPGQFVTLAGMVSDPDLALPVGEVLAVEWDDQPAASAAEIGDGFASAADAIVGYDALLEAVAASGGTIHLNVADASGAVATSSAAVTLAVPDLVATIDNGPSEGLVGQLFQACWTVENVGNAGAPGPWFDRLHVSADAIFQPGVDPPLGAALPGPAQLAVGASYQRCVQASLPTTPGTYWLFAVTDSQDGVEELSGDGNNVTAAFGPVTVSPIPLPDLAVSSVIAPSDGVLSGTTAKISFTVTNQGTGVTQPTTWTDLVFVSAQDNIAWDGINGSDQIFCNIVPAAQAVPNPQYLMPGESYSQAAQVTMPNDVQGTFYLYVLATKKVGCHPGANVNEATKDNNLAKVPFTVSLAPQPDLHPLDLDGPSTVFTGQPMTVTWIDRNDGDGPTDGPVWSDSVHLSPDAAPVIGPGDTLIKSQPVSTGSPLQPGQQKAVSTTFTVPLNVSGPVYVKVKTDAGNVISELGGETNNVTVFGPVDVAQTPAPDLVAVAVGAPQPALSYPGHSVSIAWTAANDGAPPLAPASWTDRVYFSEDEQYQPGVDIEVGAASASTVVENGQLAVPEYDRVRAVKIPEGAAAGTYRLIIVLDQSNGLFEGSCPTACEANNIAVSSVPVVVDALYADLEAGISTLSDGSGAPGSSVTLCWNTSNAGDVVTPSATWIDSVLLSTSPSSNGVVTSLASAQRTTPLGVGQAYSACRTFQVPYVAAGDYWLLVSADSGKTVFEGPEGEDDNVVAVPFTVTPEAADLQGDPASFSVSLQAEAGGTGTASWTVSNVGGLPTAATAWSDSLYLSTDATLGGDILVGTRTHSGALGPGAQYGETLNFTVPIALDGTYYVFLVIDATDAVFETSEGNNLLGGAGGGGGGGGGDDSIIEIDPVDLPNLTVAQVIPPAIVFSGQSLEVSWTVENAGPGDALTGSWSDGAYLSLDPFFDPQFDLFLGSQQRPQGLATGESYTTSAAFPAPANAAGSWFVLVRTDRSGQVAETIEADNALAADGLTDIELPSPSDLVPISVLAQESTVVLGEPSTFVRTLRNDGGQPVVGNWKDSLYLSADPLWSLDDRRIATFSSPVGDGMLPGESIEFADAVSVGGLTPGMYWLICRADVFNAIPETDELNNLKVATAPVEVLATPLLLGVPYAGSMLAGEFRAFALDVAAGETVRLALDHESPIAFTELYVKFGAMPTTGSFDFLFGNPGLPDQELLIPDTQRGTYFILARTTAGTSVPGGDDFTILAESVPFDVFAVLPNVIGAGSVTIEIEGSRFDSATQFMLRRSGSLETFQPASLELIDATRARATFDLSAASLGLYDVLASNEDRSAELPGAVEVAPPQPLALTAEVLNAADIRKGTAQNRTVRVTNAGNLDVPFAVLQIVTFNDPGVTAVVLDDSGETPFVPVGPNQQIELFLRDIPAGGTVDVVVNLAISANYAYGKVGMEVAAVPWDLEGFKVGPYAATVERARLAMLAEVSESVTDELAKAQLMEYFGDADQVLADGLAGFDEILETALSAEDGSPAEAVSSPLWCITACLIEFNAYVYFCTFLPPPANAICIVLQQTLKLKCIICGCADPCFPACPNRPTCCDKPKGDPCDPCQSPPGGAPGGPAGGGVAQGNGGEPGYGQGQEQCSTCPGPRDPNEKLGSSGFGTERWVPAKSPISYSVYFENVSTATAAASKVEIRDQLDPAFNPGSFRVGDIYIGDVVIDVPDDRISYQTVLDLTATQGVLVDIIAGVDASKVPAEAFWIFQSIDPQTGEPPTDAYSGFLPPNDQSGAGQGRVDFTIRPKLATATGVVVANDAEIVFDQNDSIITNETTNTIDSDAPQSGLAALPPALAGPTIELAPFGADAPGGSGLAGFTIHVSVDGSGFAPVAFLPAGEPVYLFNGEPGLVYVFAAQARDNAGNDTPMAGVSSVTTTIPSISLVAASDSGVIGDGVTNLATPELLVVGPPLSNVNLALAGPGPGVLGVVAIGVNGRGTFQVPTSTPLADGQWLATIDAGGVPASLAITVDTQAPAVAAWESVAPHGDLGDLPIAIPAAGGSDPRTLEMTRLRVRFDPSESADFADLQPSGATIVGRDADGQPIDLGARAVSVVPMPELLAYEVQVSPALPNAAVYCVSLDGVDDRAGNGADPGAVRRTFVVLVGDASGDARVNVTDLGGVLDLLGTAPIDPSDQGQIRCDIDRDGAIDGDPDAPAAGSDLSAVLIASGADLRAVPTPCPPLGAVVHRPSVPPAHSPKHPLHRGGSGAPDEAHQPIEGHPGVEVAARGDDGGSETTHGGSETDPTLGEGPGDLAGGWRRELPAVPGTIAVFDPDGWTDPLRLADEVARVDTALADRLLEAEVEHLPWFGWSLLVVSTDLSPAWTFEELLEIVADTGRFVAPVRADATGVRVVAGPAILVELAEDLDAEWLTDLVADLDPAATISGAEALGLPSLYLVTCSSRFGPDVEALAEAMSLASGVRRAEPDLLVEGDGLHEIVACGLDGAGRGMAIQSVSVCPVDGEVTWWTRSSAVLRATGEAVGGMRPRAVFLPDEPCRRSPLVAGLTRSMIEARGGTPQEVDGWLELEALLELADTEAASHPSNPHSHSESMNSTGASR